MFCEGLHIQISAEAEDVDFGHWGDPETPLLSSGISVSGSGQIGQAGDRGKMMMD